MPHPSPIALVPYNAPDSDPFAFSCSVCRMTWTVGADPAWARRQAEICCSTMCDTCGGEKSRHGYCAACQQQREADTDAKRYAEAKKIAPADYGGPVYSDFTARFYDDVSEAMDAAAEDGANPPPYLWPCDIEIAQIDPDRVIESITEELCEDYEVNDYAALVAFCKEWNTKQTSESWTPDYSRVIVIDGGS